MPTSNSRCEATTKTHGTQCVNGGAEWCAFNKKMLCHLHHPDSTFRKQVAAKRGPRMTTPKQAAAIARKKAKYPNRVDLSIEGRSALDRDAGGQTPEMNRVPVIDPTIGKAAPEKPSKTLFRKP